MKKSKKKIVEESMKDGFSVKTKWGKMPKMPKEIKPHTISGFMMVLRCGGCNLPYIMTEAKTGMPSPHIIKTHCPKCGSGIEISVAATACQFWTTTLDIRVVKDKKKGWVIKHGSKGSGGKAGREVAKDIAKLGNAAISAVRKAGGFSGHTPNGKRGSSRGSKK